MMSCGCISLGFRVYGYFNPSDPKDELSKPEAQKTQTFLEKLENRFKGTLSRSLHREPPKVLKQALTASL